jgi:hypothetical protein
VLLAAGCAVVEVPTVADRLTVAPEEVPAPAGSMFPFLAADATGRAVLSWTERDADSTPSVRVAVRDAAGAWGPAHTLVRDDSLFVNWADFAWAAPLPDGALVGHWLRKAPGGRFAYDIHLARSVDGGATWSPSVLPHPAGESTEHGFVSMFPTPDGGVGVQFLNGTPGATEGHAHTRTMHARLDATGAVVATGTPIDSLACDCCQTDAALTAQGPVVVYRDRSPEEIRDVAIVRRLESGWTAPALVHADGWHIAGCPVNGPAVAARGDRVVVAWFTAADSVPRVKAAFSTDAGAGFGPPVAVSANAVGRVDAALLADGRAVVVWLERADRSADVKAALVADSGVVGAPVTLARTDGTRASGFVRLAPLDGGALVSWTETGPQPRVRAARVRVGR